MSDDYGEKPRVLPGVLKLYLKVPLERIGVLIGEGGSVINELARRTQTKISVDSVNGSVVIEPLTPNTPVVNVIKAQEFIKAVSIGFSPERAWRLLNEDQVLIVIDLKQVIGNSPNHLSRIKGRIIGEGGRVKKNLEEMTGTYINVYEDYVGIIGDYESANVAREAIEMLIQGRQHSTVYKYVDRVIRELKRSKLTGLWLKEPKM